MSEPAPLPEESPDPTSGEADRVESVDAIDLEPSGAPTELARIVDPVARDAAEGARALLRVEVPPEWLTTGGTLELASPERLVCARCEGGGCGGCGNSGALRVEQEDRDLELTLSAGTAVAKRLRLEHPFGEGSEIRQLLVDLVPRLGASPVNARWFPTAAIEAPLMNAASDHPLAREARGPTTAIVVASVIVVAALILAIAFASR